MNEPLDIRQFSPSCADPVVLQLMDHIASGFPSVWVVSEGSRTASGAVWRFDNYQDASNKFDSLPADGYPTLSLYTRIGTSVRFRFKEPKAAKRG
jgi:hypothetical protein